MTPQPTTTITGKFSSCTLFLFCDSRQRLTQMPQAHPLSVGRTPSLTCLSSYPEPGRDIWRPEGPLVQLAA